jgi:hypothetical protein
MNKINYGRVILGGLVCGLVLNIGEFVFNGVLMANQMKTWNAQHNFPLEPGGSFMVIVTLLTFVLGIVMVLCYACIRPRFGPGVKTAILASLFFWFGLCFYMGYFFVALWQWPINFYVLGMVWCLVEYGIATVAGAALYKE